MPPANHNDLERLFDTYSRAIGDRRPKGQGVVLSIEYDDEAGVEHRTVRWSRPMSAGVRKLRGLDESVR